MVFLLVGGRREAGGHSCLPPAPFSSFILDGFRSNYLYPSDDKICSEAMWERWHVLMILLIAYWKLNDSASRIVESINLAF